MWLDHCSSYKLNQVSLYKTNVNTSISINEAVIKSFVKSPIYVVSTETYFGKVVMRKNSKSVTEWDQFQVRDPLMTYFALLYYSSYLSS